jgi:hypothetical protein
MANFDELDERIPEGSPHRSSQNAVVHARWTYGTSVERLVSMDGMIRLKKELREGHGEDLIELYEEIVSRSVPTEDMLWMFAVCPDARVRKDLAGWNRQQSIVRVLARDPDPEVVAGLLEGRSDLPIEELEYLARHESVSIRARVAQREDLPLGLLRALSRDPDRAVSSAVSRRGTPMNTVETVRQAFSTLRGVRKTGNVETGITEKLSPLWTALVWARRLIAARKRSKREYDAVCLKMVHEARTDIEEAMVAVCECEQAKAALALISTSFDTARILANKNPSIDVAYNLLNEYFWPKLPIDILEALARHESDTIRYHLAARQDAPTSLISTLQDDALSLTRIEVAKREDLPEEILQGYLADPDGRVRDTARATLAKRTTAEAAIGR